MKTKVSTTRKVVEERPGMNLLTASPRGLLAGSALNVVRAASAWLRSLRKKRRQASPRPVEQPAPDPSRGWRKRRALIS